jgi:predicted regulator of Ras-like GTPase activity (Roadblock/LC7/MglB family)
LTDTLSAIPWAPLLAAAGAAWATVSAAALFGLSRYFMPRREVAAALAANATDITRVGEKFNALLALQTQERETVDATRDRVTRIEATQDAMVGLGQEANKKLDAVLAGMSEIRERVAAHEALLGARRGGP